MRAGAIRLAVALGLAGAALLAAPATPASAHPLGNFTVNAYGGVTVQPGQLRVEYVLDLAEIPTFQEMARIDADGDGVVESEERATWASGKAAELGGGLSVAVNGQELTLAPEASIAVLRPGQGGLDVVRLEASFTAPVPPDGRVIFRDRNDQGRLGWREITAIGEGGVAVTGSSVPAASVSGGLLAYPEDLLSNPLDVREASFSFGPGPQGRGSVGSGGNTVGRPGTTDGPLAALMARPALSVPVVLLSLLVAFGVGALHALAPGHGKTVTAAYLAGAGGGLRHAVGAGAAVSIMHTASVGAVGLLVLFAERAFPPERVYPWLGIAAGVVAAGLGTGLLVSRVRAAGHGHAHPHRPLSRRGLAALAVSGGLLPSPTALVLLLAAVSLHRVAFGMSLIVAFGLGLAAALTAVGIVAVRARDLLARRRWERLAAALPILSAVVILAVGLVLLGRAAVQL